ncbi:MAG: PIN domain-containing protein [Rhodothermales bacterium]
MSCFESRTRSSIRRLGAVRTRASRCANASRPGSGSGRTGCASRHRHARPSNRGGSFAILSLIDSGSFEVSVSVPLVLEYEYAMVRAGAQVKVSKRTVLEIIDYICSIGRKAEIYDLWRPFLSDPNDDMILEVAVADGCDAIVTHNVRDFTGAETFGIDVLTTKDFLKLIRSRK